MKNPESIIRGIMHESVMSEVKKHVGSTDPKTVKAHFRHDEKAAKRIGKLAGSMEEAIDPRRLRAIMNGEPVPDLPPTDGGPDARDFDEEPTPQTKSSKPPSLDLNALRKAVEEKNRKPSGEGPKPIDEAKGRSNYLYGINHVQTGAHRDIIKLAKTLGYGVSIPGGSSGTMKVRTPEGRLITQITTDGGPGGNRRALVDIHRHQIEIGGFNGMDHTHDTIRDAQRGIQEEIEQLDEKSEAWQRKEGKNPEGGLNKKGVESYRRSHPGSELKTAVTTKPSKLKPGSKAAKRRKSFCARMKGMKARLTSAKTARDPDSRINKSLRKWNCE